MKLIKSVQYPKVINEQSPSTFPDRVTQTQKYTNTEIHKHTNTQKIATEYCQGHQNAISGNSGFFTIVIGGHRLEALTSYTFVI